MPVTTRSQAKLLPAIISTTIHKPNVPKPIQFQRPPVMEAQIQETYRRRIFAGQGLYVPTPNATVNMGLRRPTSKSSLRWDLLPIRRRYLIILCAIWWFTIYHLFFYPLLFDPIRQAWTVLELPSMPKHNETAIAAEHGHRNLNLDLVDCKSGRSYHHCMQLNSYSQISVANQLKAILPTLAPQPWSDVFHWRRSTHRKKFETLTSVQEHGLRLWSECDYSSNSMTDTDLQCWYNAFDLIFFHGALQTQNVKLQWTENAPNIHYYGITKYYAPSKSRYYAPSKSTDIEIVLMVSAPGESHPSVLLHEMIHAVLHIYSCHACQHDGLEAAHTRGITGHGPAFMTLAKAIEERAGDVLYTKSKTGWGLGLDRSLAFEATTILKRRVLQVLTDMKLVF